MSEHRDYFDTTACNPWWLTNSVYSPVLNENANGLSRNTHGKGKLVKSNSIADKTFACTRTNLDASRSCGDLIPEYFSNVAPIFFRLAFIFPASPWSTSCFKSVRKKLISTNDAGILFANRWPTLSWNRK